MINVFYSQGLTVLFHGSPGTGKTLAAEAIGYEVGRPLKVFCVCVCVVCMFVCVCVCVCVRVCAAILLP